jgi:hypothetical protein
VRRALQALLLAGCVCARPELAAAQDTVTDERVWFTLILQENGSPTSPWRGQSEVVLRSREGVSELDVFSLRQTLIYALDKHSSVGAGYAFSPMFPPNAGMNVEQRVYGQYGFTSGWAGGTVTTRTRLEARFIEGNSGTLMRLRNQARYAHPVHRGSKVSWMAYDELLLHLNDTTLRPKGIDHNRLFGGLQVAAWRNGRVEAGYLNQFLPGHRGAADRMNHILSTVLAVSF